MCHVICQLSRPILKYLLTLVQIVQLNFKGQNKSIKSEWRNLMAFCDNSLAFNRGLRSQSACYMMWRSHTILPRTQYIPKKDQMYLWRDCDYLLIVIKATLIKWVFELFDTSMASVIHYNGLKDFCACPTWCKEPGNLQMDWSNVFLEDGE